MRECRGSKETHLDEIEDPKGNERSMQLLYLLIMQSEGANDESGESNTLHDRSDEVMAERRTNDSPRRFEKS